MRNSLCSNLIPFFGTLGVPAIYGLNLYLISIGGGFSIPDYVRLVFVIFGLIGLLLWIVSFVNLGKSFGVLPQKKSRVSKGLYSKMRHPMYVGIMMTYIGLSIANQSLAGILMTMFFLLPLLILRAKFEEKMLDN